MRDFIEAINSRVVVYDGGMGATLEMFDLPREDYGGLPGKCHEALVLHRPDVIAGVHESMLDAGAEVVETDTFQGSRIKLDEWGLGEHTLEINRRAAEIARRAVGEDRFVAGSIGPTGHLPASEDPSLGQIRFLGEFAPVPIHCIPNAGIPHQGPNGETIFPETPEQIATVLGEFVERYGVNIVGGCCGTTPDHIYALAQRVEGRGSSTRPAPRPPHVSSMITAAPLVQEPRPTLVGERVNSQGSRKAKELLLAEDYDGLLQVAEDQVEGGAHVLDVCVALTERQDEDEQMRQVVKKISLSQPAPVQIDSTEPDVLSTALDQIPGRAIVNSVNLEAGRDKLDRVVPLALAHGAALIALTIDEVGMAKTADRKVEIAKRIRDLACDDHGLDPELLIFDALTFTLTTGDEEWRPSAVETIEGIRRIKAELPGVKTSLGVSNVSFGVSPGARAVLNSVFLHHCVQAGLDLAMVNPHHITPYGEIPEQERELADDLVWRRREDALERFIAHFEAKGEQAADA